MMKLFWFGLITSISINLAFAADYQLITNTDFVRIDGDLISGLPGGPVIDRSIKERNLDAPYRVGFNMIRTTDSSNFDSEEEVLADIAEVGGQGIRQLQGNDLTWFQVYDGSGSLNSSSNYNFSEAEKLIVNNDEIYTIPTLFWIGPGSAARFFGDDCPEDGGSDSDYCKQPYTPAGDVLKVSNEDVEADVRSYVSIVGNHFKEHGLKHYEIGNEPSRFKHWDYAIAYDFKWEPKKYVDLMKVSREELKAIDSDIQIVMAGQLYLDQFEKDKRQEKWEDWFDKVLNKGGGDYLDIVNMHFYGNWWQLQDHMDEVKNLMSEHGISNKPLWLTEVGNSAEELGEQRQAEDIFRYFSIAFCNGVELVNWHTHINSNNTDSNWGGYGVRKKGGTRYDSWYTYQLFAKNFGNFGICTRIKNGSSNLWVYKFSGALYGEKGTMPDRIIAFSKDGSQSLDLSSHFPGYSRVKVTSVYTEDGDNFENHTQDVGKKINVTATPKIIEGFD